MQNRNRIKKRVMLFAVLSVTAAFLLAAEPVMAATTYTEGDYYYQIKEDAVVITGYFGYDTKITLPSMIAGYPVSTIGAGAFRNTKVKTIHLPDTIMTIEKDAIPAGVTVQYAVDKKSDGKTNGKSDGVSQNNSSSSGSDQKADGKSDSAGQNHNNTGSSDSDKKADKKTDNSSATSRKDTGNTGTDAAKNNSGTDKNRNADRDSSGNNTSDQSTAAKSNEKNSATSNAAKSKDGDTAISNDGSMSSSDNMQDSGYGVDEAESSLFHEAEELSDDKDSKAKLSVDSRGRLVAKNKNGKTVVMDDSRKYQKITDANGNTSIVDEDGNKAKLSEDGKAVIFTAKNGKKITREIPQESKIPYFPIIIAVVIAAVIAVGGVLIWKKRKSAAKV